MAMAITLSLTAPTIAAPAISDSQLEPAPLLSPYVLTPAQISKLDTDIPVLDVWENAEKRSIVEVFGAIDIDATPTQIWKIMTDCDMQLQIVPNMTRCEIEKGTAATGWDERVQVLNIGFLLPRVKSKFKSEYSPYREIKITRTGGDLSVLDGLWKLAVTPDGQTRVTYRARLKPKLPVPRKLVQKATRQDMPEVLKNLKNLAETHSQAPSSLETASFETTIVQTIP